MSKNVGVAEVKRHFSDVISKVSQKSEHYIIERKGKPIAALVNINDLEIIEAIRKLPRGKGLLAAVGAWEEFEGIEGVINDIYRKRKKAKDRDMKGIV
jgi:prevent-host-death family protein